jgi:dihydrofolate reductase
MNLSIIVAVAENNAIGKNNDLLWRLSADLKYFKKITSGHTIIMGRKTFDSIGKPLPNRRSIVITRDKDLKIEGAEVVNSLAAAISLCEKESEVFIIGGAEIYHQALPKANTIYLTKVHRSYDADVFFPELLPNEWKEVSREDYPADEKNEVPYSFCVLKRL